MSHPGGRPTKYNEEMLAKTEAFFQRYFHAPKTIETITHDKDGKEIKVVLPNPEYYKPPYKEQLALELDIDDETIIEWGKIYPEFSAIIKKIEQLQRVRLYDLTFEKNSATGSIFQLKVHHGMVETEKRILAGDEENPIHIDVNETLDKIYGSVDEMPPSSKG